MNSLEKIRIVLADDHAVVREGLKTLIHTQPDMAVVGEASDGSVVVALALESKADVVIVDVSMPEVNGAAATRQLKKTNPAVKVLALTVHEDLSYLEEMLAAGASGYVLKRAAANELINAVRLVAKGGTYLDPQVAGGLVESLVHKRRPQPETNPLTERELMVGRLMAQGYTNKEIASQLDLSVKTVETHKAHCMEKLGLRSRAELVQFALREGWLAAR